jgi:hypothetical protein
MQHSYTKASCLYVEQCLKVLLSMLCDVGDAEKKKAAQGGPRPAKQAM